MAGEDRERTVDLFRQHRPGEFVRQGNPAEGDDFGGAGEYRLRPTIRGADAKEYSGCACVSMLTDQLGETFGTQQIAAGIAQNDGGDAPPGLAFGCGKERRFRGKAYDFYGCIPCGAQRVVADESLAGFTFGEFARRDGGDEQLQVGPHEWELVAEKSTGEISKE